MSDAITKKDVQGIYLTYILRFYEHALRAYLERDLEGLYATAKALAAMLPDIDFNHKAFFKRLDSVMDAVEDDLDTDEEREERRLRACDIIFGQITELVTPVISSLGIRIRKVPVFTVGGEE